MFIIDLPAKFSFEEAYIPPRCRNSRFRLYQGSTVVSIPCVTATEAPVVFSYIAGYQEDRHKVDYRKFDGFLYTRKQNGGGCWTHEKGWMNFSDMKQFVLDNYLCRYIKDTDWNPIIDISSAISRVHGIFHNLLVVDHHGHKEIWERAFEPMYVVMTFGLGHNHGGTALMIEEYSYNPNIARQNYFNALQYEEACAYAIGKAKKRGDTDYLNSIRKARRIKVYDPSAVTANPHLEPDRKDIVQNDGTS